MAEKRKDNRGRNLNLANITIQRISGICSER